MLQVDTEKLKWHYEVFELYKQMNQHRIITSYTGPFDHYILISLGISLKEAVSESMSISKKFFKIFLELAQNISLYSLERAEGAGFGTVIVKEFKDYLEILGGNFVNAETKRNLDSKIQLINSLNREELRALKRRFLGQKPSDSGGGNIGLIQIALLSRYKLNIKFIPVQKNEQILYFYIISVRIDKKHYKTQ